MKKKPAKIEEHAKPCAAGKANQEMTAPALAAFQPRHVDDVTFKKSMEKVFRVHGDVLRRLAEYDRGNVS